MYNVCKHIFLNNLFTFIFKAGYRALNVYFNIIYSIIKVCFMLTIVCTVNTPDSSFWEMWCLNKSDLIWSEWVDETAYYYTMCFYHRYILFRLNVWTVSWTSYDRHGKKFACSEKMFQYTNLACSFHVPLYGLATSAIIALILPSSVFIFIFEIYRWQKQIPYVLKYVKWLLTHVYILTGCKYMA